MKLTREALLGWTPELKELSDVPGWEGSVWIREISTAERNRWADARLRYATAETPDPALLLDARLMLVELALCDADGNAVLEEGDAANLRPHFVDHIASEVERFNGLTDEAQEAVEGN